MSGIEVAGLVLAVLPLIISAVEDYEVTFQPFVTYCRYAKELRSLRANLGTQKQLFRNHCIILLSRIEAERLLEDHSDLNQRWKSNDVNAAEIALEKRLAAYLGSKYDACLCLIKTIEETLHEIQEETRGLNEITSEDDSIRDRARCQDFSQRLRFSFSKPKLKSKLDKLRELNHDFLALRQTIECLQKVHSQSLTTTSFEQSLEKLNFVQAASLRLHEALANVWSCSVHNEHSVNISINANVDTGTAQALEDAAVPRIRFEMAFSSLPAPAKASQTPMWLEIETSKTMQVKCPKVPPSIAVTEKTEAFTASLKRRAEHFLEMNAELPSTPKKKEKKAVSFLLLPKQQGIDASKAVEMDDTVPTESSRSDPLPELYCKTDLCLHLQQCHQNSQSDASECIGVLQRTRTFNHIVYRRSASDSPAISVSLDTVLSNLAETKPTSGLSCLERVRLARSLATAILQFRSTPWLPEDWRSRNVHFYGINTPCMTQPSSLNTPLLNATFSTRDRQRYIGNDSQIATSEDAALSPIRNNVLFGLGLIMIELGFETTMSTLRHDKDLRAGQVHSFTDYLTARRLKKTIVTPLGKRYGRITQKCLDCEFGVGEYDLDAPALQAAFYKEVVQELSDLEKAFKRLDVG